MQEVHRWETKVSSAFCKPSNFTFLRIYSLDLEGSELKFNNLPKIMTSANSVARIQTNPNSSDAKVCTISTTLSCLLVLREPSLADKKAEFPLKP